MVSRRSRQVSVLEECLYGCYYVAPDDIYHIREIRGRRYLGGALSSTLVPLQTKLSESDPGYGIVSRGRAYNKQCILKHRSCYS